MQCAFLLAVVVTTAFSTIGRAASYSELHDAVRRGDIDSVHVLLKTGADPRQHDDLFGWTPLHYAVMDQFNPAVIELLIEHGADVNAVSSEGVAPIHYAASRHNPSLIRLLVDAGARPDVADQCGSTPLMYLLKGITHDPAATLESAEVLLAAGASTAIDSAASSPMQLAAAKHGPAIINSLLQHGADIHVRDSTGNSLLAVAALAHNVPAIEFLVERLDVGAANDAGQTPLMLALQATHACSDCLALLLENGANPNVQDKLGVTALHIAATRGSPADVRMLLEAGADARKRNHEDRSALSLAILRVERCKQDLTDVPNATDDLRNARAVAVNLIRRGKSVAAQTALQDSLAIVAEMLSRDER